MKAIFEQYINRTNFSTICVHSKQSKSAHRHMAVFTLVAAQSIQPSAHGLTLIRTSPSTISGLFSCRLKRGHEQMAQCWRTQLEMHAKFGFLMSSPNWDPPFLVGCTTPKLLMQDTTINTINIKPKPKPNCIEMHKKPAWTTLPSRPSKPHSKLGPGGPPWEGNSTAGVPWLSQAPAKLASAKAKRPPSEHLKGCEEAYKARLFFEYLSSRPD